VFLPFILIKLIGLFFWTDRQGWTTIVKYDSMRHILAAFATQERRRLQNLNDGALALLAKAQDIFETHQIGTSRTLSSLGQAALCFSSEDVDPARKITLKVC
jgi:hypothetical protein